MTVVFHLGVDDTRTGFRDVRVGMDISTSGDRVAAGQEDYVVITDTVTRLDDVRSRVSLTPVGDIDAGTVDELAQQLHEALLTGAHEIDLDLAEVPFMDTAAVEVLQGAREMLEGAGGHLCVRNATTPVRRLLSLTAFTPRR